MPELKSSRLFFTTIECGLVGLEGRASRLHFHIFTIEFRCITIITLAIHLRGNDAILHSLESITNCILGIKLTLGTTVKEFTSIEIILGGSVRDLILEEFLLSLLECRIVFKSFRNVAHGVSAISLHTASLL